MRFFVILLSFLLLLALLLYNYYQFREIRYIVTTIYATTDNQKSNRQYREATRDFYMSLVRKEQAPEKIFESFSNSALFAASVNNGHAESVYSKWPRWQQLATVEDGLSLQKQRFNRLSFNALTYQQSLEPVSQWVVTTNEQLDMAQGLYADLIRFSAERMESKLNRLLLINGILLISIISLWYWLSYDKQKRHLQATLALNQDLENKKRNLLASQRVMASIFDDMKHERSHALALAEDNQQLASIVEQASDAIFRLDLAGVIQNVNDAAKVYFNLNGEILDGYRFAELFCDADQKAIANALAESQSRRAATVIHARPAKRYAQQEQTYEASLSVLVDNQNTVIGLVALVRDVSYQYQEIDQLRKIIYQAPNALVMVNEQGVIVLSNGKADSLFGYEAGELLGESVEILVPQALQSSHQELRDIYFESPVARNMAVGRELKLIKKDGSQLSVEIGLSPIIAKEKRYVVASVVDISESVNAQAALNSINRQLSEKNREMEQFIYTVSHDLRSPLVTIEAFAKKLADELHSSLTEKQHHRLSRIQANVSHMEQLLTDLLNLSRIIKQEIDKQAVDTRRVVDKVIRTLEAEIRESQGSIEVRGELMDIWANESMLHQALQNLISNAIKYRDPERPLMVNLSTREENNHVALSVADNGLGIDAKYHDQVFRIFERLEVGSGTGVGLSIVNTIMEKHEGRIRLDSEPGQGSTFTLVFPKQKDT